MTADTQLPPSENDISLLDVLVLLAENARLLIFGPLVVGLVALGIAFLIPPTFTATARILPPQQQQSTAAMLASQISAIAGLAGAPGLNLKNPADLYVALINSRTVADRMIDRFNLLALYEKQYRQDARKALDEVTRASSGKDGLITIDVDDKDPKRAADMANAYVDELSRLNDGLAITEAQQRRSFFEKQLLAAQENLKGAQLRLGETGVPASLVKSSPEALVESIARLKAQVAAQEVKVATMRSYLTGQSPELQLAQYELASLRAQFIQAERNEPARQPQHAEYLNRYRDFKYNETLFELMAKQYEIARLDEAREGAVVQIVDKAVPPELKSKPRRGLIAVLATFGSAFLLVLYVLARDTLRQVRSGTEASERLRRIQSGLKELMRRRS